MCSQLNFPMQISCLQYEKQGKFQKITGGVTLSTTTTCVTGGQYLQELT